MGEVCSPRVARGITNEPYTVPLASPRQRWQYRLLVVAWLIGQVSFWTWWLQGDHVVTLLGMFLNSLLLVWTTFLPAWLLFFVGRARRPNPAMPLPEGRVAMVVTKAPSEPWPLVRNTLEKMLAQDFPGAYDVWLADEDPSAETRAWCAEHGVSVSCRKGVAGYNNPTWPRRQKCKEGNLAYFYEVMGGYDRYEFVSQLDADHVPEPTYLTEVIRPFADPSVGYVAAPSVCDANAKTSWSARGRLFAEAALHGVLQAGYNAGFAPLCIGSHYAVRTAALRSIGGLGPELAEDFSTTVLMNAGGWRGAFAIDALAHGDGPISVGDCLTQEFQWSASVTRLFVSMWQECSDRIPLAARLQLGFGPIWYLLFTGNLLLGYTLPILALVFHTPWVSVNLIEFFIRASIPSAVALLTVAWIRRCGWLRPSTAQVLSWETVLFEYVRWPWMAIGIGHALIGRLLRREFSFRVTPKGVAEARPVAQRVLLPYFVIVLAEAGATILVEHPGDAIGYAYLAWLAAASYTVVIAAVVLLQLKENARRVHIPLLGHVRAALRSSSMPALSSLLVGAAMLVRGQAALAAVITPTADPNVGLPFNGQAAVVLQQAAAQKTTRSCPSVAPARRSAPVDTAPTVARRASSRRHACQPDPADGPRHRPPECRRLRSRAGARRSAAQHGAVVRASERSAGPGGRAGARRESAHAAGDHRAVADGRQHGRAGRRGERQVRRRFAPTGAHRRGEPAAGRAGALGPRDGARQPVSLERPGSGRGTSKRSDTWWRSSVRKVRPTYASCGRRRATATRWITTPATTWSTTSA